MSNPIVSVAMVVYNVDRFLAEAIDSILAQSFRDFEFIIVDFGSTDNSKPIVQNYAAKDSRIRFHEIPHCSLVAARNASCSLAQGEYIAIMDADDVSLANRIALEVEFMEKHPEVGALGGLTETINAGSEVVPGRIHHPPADNHEIKTALGVRCPFCQSSVMIRRKAFELVGGYREAFLQAEDYDLWLRIAEHFQWGCLRQVVHRYRVHPYQLSIQRHRQQALCVLAARASASVRRSGGPDPLDSAKEITPAMLSDLGVTKSMQESELANNCRNWIRNLCGAGEHSAALEATLAFLQSDLQYVERSRIADFHLVAARLYWLQKRTLRSLLAVGHAVMTRPKVAGRPLKVLLHRARLI